MQTRLAGLSSIVALLCLPLAAGAAPILYSVQSNGNDRLYRIDAATGVATDLGQLPFEDAEGLAFVGNALYAIGGTLEEFWTISTPPGTMTGETGPRDGGDAGLDVDPVSGRLYNLNGSSAEGRSWLYTIDPATGAATLVGRNDVYADGLAIDAGGRAYAIDAIRTGALYAIDLGTGAASLIGSLGLAGVTAQFGLTFAEGILYALGSSGGLYSVDPATGAATFVADTTCGGVPCFGWEGLAARTTVAVAEPGVLALLGLGFGGIAAARRRGRRSWEASTRPGIRRAG